MQYISITITICMLMFTGCTSHDRMAISGEVMFDGKPLEDGMISFRPVNPNGGNSAGGKITNGAFLFSADHGLVPGKYLATVQAFLRTGRTFKDPQRGDVPEMVQIKYNEAGKLEATVIAGEENRFNFQLTGVKPRRF